MSKKKSKNRLKPVHVHTKISRHDNAVLLEKDIDAETQKTLIDNMAKKYKEVCDNVDFLVKKIRDKVAVLDPIQLLQRSFQLNAFSTLGKTSEYDLGFNDAIHYRMIDYIQNVIVSTPMVSRNEVDEDTWKELFQDVAELYRILSLDYHMVNTAYKIKNDPNYDHEYDKFYVQAQMMWTGVRGNRYMIHEIVHLRDLLMPHDSIFKELFSLSADEFIEGIEKIQNEYIFGLQKIVDSIKEVYEDIKKGDSTDINLEVIQELQKNFLEFGLINVQTITGFPASLLKELSWEEGENTQFFEGEKPGWPLKIMPMQSRPFFAINGVYYCFDYYSLMDNIYRVIRRVILRLKPQYAEDWNAIQKQVTEYLPVQLIKKNWANAVYYKDVYYKSKIGKNEQWCECDGVLFYDDHLIVIEVKAGAFTYTSPTDDFDAFITSIKNLAIKPAEQGRRFLEYMRDSETVEIYDENHNKIYEFSSKKIRHTTICCVSLDSFTTFAAKIGNLIPLGLNVAEPIWSISIDDLRVYTDIIQSPTVFAHFLEYRKNAFSSSKLDLDDELDHLGLYFQFNDYAKHTEKLSEDKSATVMWNGMRQEIDTYYHNLLIREGEVIKPSQPLPPMIKIIIDAIDSKNVSGKCLATKSLLDTDQRTRDALNDGISDRLISQKQKGRMTPLSTTGEVRVTFFCRQPGISLLNSTKIEEFVYTLMNTGSEKNRQAYILDFDESGILTDISFKLYDMNNCPSNLLPHISKKSNELIQSRINSRLKDGKIGRNEMCPCGSGKKYKRCCGK